jgi:Zn-dependent protease with chaperone function
MLSQAMLCAIVYGLTKDANWDVRHNAGRSGRPSGWGAVIAAVAALMIGGTALMSTIAFSAQRYFEFQAAATAAENSR